MKKVFYVLSGLCFLNPAYTESSESQVQNAIPLGAKVKVTQPLTSKDLHQISTKEDIVDSKYIPDFWSVNEIAKNENVQNSVRILMAKLQKLLKTILKKEATGNSKDIAEAVKRVHYLNSVFISLEEAKNLDRIGRMPWLNQEGITAIKDAISMIEAFKNSTNFEDLKKVPGINDKVVSMIDECENLKASVTKACDLEMIKKISGLNGEGIKAIQQLQANLNSVKALTKVEDIPNNQLIPLEIRKRVTDLLSQQEILEKADTLKKLYTIPGLNKKTITLIQGELQKYVKLWKTHKELQDKYASLEDKSNSINDEQEKNRRFLTRLFGALLRALIGFDYRSTSFDFAKSKEAKTIDKSAMIAASKISLSHMGGKEEDLYVIINGIQNIMKILINEKDLVVQAPSLKDQLDKIKKVSDTFNDDANLIKFNIGYAIDIVDNLINGAKRPPRDNVQNFSNISVKSS